MVLETSTRPRDAWRWTGCSLSIIGNSSFPYGLLLRIKSCSCTRSHDLWILDSSGRGTPLICIKSRGHVYTTTQGRHFVASETPMRSTSIIASKVTQVKVIEGLTELWTNCPLHLNAVRCEEALPDQMALVAMNRLASGAVSRTAPFTQMIRWHSWKGLRKGQSMNCRRRIKGPN